MLFEKLKISNIVVYKMPLDILIRILEQKNDWSIVIFNFLCVGFYCCWSIFIFLYLLFLLFFYRHSPLRFQAYMIFKTMRWCIKHLSKIIFLKFAFYLFYYLSTFDLNCLSFPSFIQQHLIIARIEDNLRHLAGP